MGRIYYTKDINWNIVETEIRDEREERIKELEEENRKLREENETLSADNQRFRARLDMLGEKE